MIGARKSYELWNHARYYNVKAFIDEEFVTATGTDAIPEDWKIHFDFAPTQGRRVELIWFYQYAQVANIYIHYKKIEQGSNGETNEVVEKPAAQIEVETLDFQCNNDVFVVWQGVNSGASGTPDDARQGPEVANC